MPGNFLSPSNSTSPPPSPSSLGIYPFLHNCFRSTLGTSSIIAFTITSILVLVPLCAFVLHLGLQRWRQRRSNTMTSHSDVFTYHMVGSELMSVLGYGLVCCTVHTDLIELMKVGICLFSINYSEQIYFHILTCVERYLAVVHPVTYLSLRKEKGIRVRNIAISCVWLLCIVGIGLMFFDDYILVIASFCVMGLNVIILSFCSLSVLYVLKNPGPGEGARGRQRGDQLKLRALYTITAILGVLLIRIGGNLLSIAVYASSDVGKTGKCVGLLVAVWSCFPSSLVLPLLFLHRAQKLLCCKKNYESGQGSE